MAPRAAKRVPRGAKMPPRRPLGAPRSPKMESRCRQEEANRLQMAPRWTQDGAKRRPRGSTINQVGFNMARRMRKARQAKISKKKKKCFLDPGRAKMAPKSLQIAHVGPSWGQEALSWMPGGSQPASRWKPGEARGCKPASGWKPEGVSRLPASPKWRRTTETQPGAQVLRYHPVQRLDLLYLLTFPQSP